MTVRNNPISRKRTIEWTFKWKGDSAYVSPAFNVLDGTFVPGKLADLGSTAAFLNQVVVSDFLDTERDAVSGVDQLVISTEITRTAGAGTISTITFVPLYKLQGMAAGIHGTATALSHAPTAATGAVQVGMTTHNNAGYPLVALCLGTVTGSGTNAASEFDIVVRFTE
jgi:hypothetical protein